MQEKYESYQKGIDERLKSVKDKIKDINNPEKDKNENNGKKVLNSALI